LLSCLITVLPRGDLNPGRRLPTVVPSKENRMSMLAGMVGAVIGVDTHRDHHTVAVVDPTGAALTSTELPTDAFGYRRMLAFARDHAPGRRVWPSKAPAASVPA